METERGAGVGRDRQGVQQLLGVGRSLKVRQRQARRTFHGGLHEARADRVPPAAARAASGEGQRRRGGAGAEARLGPTTQNCGH